jgi:hypothetical protein
VIIRDARDALEAAWPPAPHDPRERELALFLDGWEVRIFGGRMFQYFVSRGFWHVQLWHPVARVSLLTPSRLTCGFYEAFPVSRWKAQAADYEVIARAIQRVHGVSAPKRAEAARIERALVDDVVGGDWTVAS